MRRLALTLALLWAAGCGGDRERAAARPDDRRAVQERVAAYLRAYAAGAGGRACAQYTEVLRARSDARAAAAGNRSCAATLTALGPALRDVLPPAAAERLGDPAAVLVELRGDRAFATQPGAGHRLELVRGADGRWLIADLGVREG